jgi:hypothetical protein
MGHGGNPGGDVWPAGVVSHQGSDPKLLLNDNDEGKPEGIHLMIGRRPHAAFGNSTGNKQMLEHTAAGTARV